MNNVQLFGGVWGLFCLLVFVAISVDLVSGWRKATERHEAHTSYALSRTISKVLMYQGVMIVTGCIDVVLSVCHVTQLLHVVLLDNLPVMSGLMCVLLCLVELKSIYEKAEDKSRRRLKETAEILTKILHNGMSADELKKILENSKHVEDEQVKESVAKN